MLFSLPFARMSGVLLGWDVNVGQGVEVAVVVCEVPVGEVAGVHVGVWVRDGIAVAVGEEISVDSEAFKFIGPVIGISTAAVCASGEASEIEAIIGEAVALTDDTTWVTINTEATSAARCLCEAIDLFR